MDFDVAYIANHSSLKLDVGFVWPRCSTGYFTGNVLRLLIDLQNISIMNDLHYTANDNIKYLGIVRCAITKAYHLDL